MRIKFRTQNLTEPEEAQFKEYLEQKLKRIKPIIDEHYPDEDTAKLNVGIEKIKQFKRVVFKVNYTLDIPRTHKPLAARGAKHTVTESMDMATSKLESEVTKHFEILTRQ